MTLVSESWWNIETIGIVVLLLCVIVFLCVLMLLVNRIHKFLTFLKCWTKDAESQEIEQQTIRYIPESIAKLEALTKFDKEELKFMYRNFKNECPLGVIKEETFKSIYSLFFPAGDADVYATLVFKAFDDRDEGYLTFEKFVVILSSLLRGSLHDRLRWTFSLYDVNHDGFITRDEIVELVRSVYLLLGNYTEQTISEDDCEAHADRVFTKFASKGRDEISFEEFCRVCHDDENISQSLNIFQDHI